MDRNLCHIRNIYLTHKLDVFAYINNFKGCINGFMIYYSKNRLI